MKRFRFTLLAISLILLYLGAMDLKLVLNNQDVQRINIEDLIAGKEHRELILIQNGYLDLKNAISTSGSIEIEALLVPLTAEPGLQPYKIFIEMRSPEVLKLVNKYNFDIDTDYLREKYFNEHKSEFYPQVNINGMMFSSLVANQSQVKLVKLVKDVGLQVDENIIFVSEDKTPPKYRGIFFFIIGILGGLKAFTMFQKAGEEKV